MTEIDFFGHFFYALIFCGMWFLKHKSPVGWQYRLVGEVGWFGIGIITGLSSIWFWSLIFMWMDWQGYRKWKQEERDQEDAEDIEAIRNSKNPGEVVWAQRPGHILEYNPPKIAGKFGICYDPYDVGVQMEAARLDRL